MYQEQLQLETQPECQPRLNFQSEIETVPPTPCVNPEMLSLVVKHTEMARQGKMNEIGRAHV